MKYRNSITRSTVAPNTAGDRFLLGFSGILKTFCSDLLMLMCVSLDAV